MTWSDKEVHEYVDTLHSEFSRSANPTIAKQQKAYLRDKFEFFGIKTPERRMLSRPFIIKESLPPKQSIPEVIHILWQKPERDFQLFGLDLVQRLPISEPGDLELFKYMVTHKSWWDTVDFIAVHPISKYFIAFPKSIPGIMDQWLQSNNLWLQRCTLIFQLKWKEKLDTSLLHHCIQSMQGSKEFFINKAIGWILREYSKTDPQWVRDYVANHELAPLSQREALRLLH